MKVQTVAEAGPNIQRVLDWCRQRGIVKIESNDWDEQTSSRHRRPDPQVAHQTNNLSI